MKCGKQKHDCKWYQPITSLFAEGVQSPFIEGDQLALFCAWMNECCVRRLLRQGWVRAWCFQWRPSARRWWLCAGVCHCLSARVWSGRGIFLARLHPLSHWMNKRSSLWHVIRNIKENGWQKKKKIRAGHAISFTVSRAKKIRFGILFYFF